LTTAEELEQITDTSKFELLATAILCKEEKDYRAILHPGLNAQNQPIKSPVDGFCRVPNSIPPHFILVEHTIEDNLEKKWLFDHRTVVPSKKGRKNMLSESDDGDLLKAGQLAQNFKVDLPDAIFTVVLTTNQGLKSALYLKVETKAKEIGVEVDFWDRSRITRFLDTEPEGQWLRKEYLGVEAEMLSESLLHTLCAMSLNEYKKQFLTTPDRWISRQIDRQVEKEIGNQSCSIHLLIGNSGSGKSAIAYQIGQKHLDKHGYSLWLSENVLTASDSLTSAIDKALCDLYPSLMPNAGEEALRLLKGERLLLITDDVNRTSNPTSLLEKLVNWSKPISFDTKTIPSKHLLICPVWTNIAGSINRDVNKIPWLESTFIGVMSPEEGLKAIKSAISLNNIDLTNMEANILSDKLGNDPILIGVFGSLVSESLNIKPDQLSHLTDNVIDSFIDTNFKNVSHTGDLLAGEYRQVVSNFATQMLLRRNLTPNWNDIKEWFGDSSEEIKGLRILVKDGKLCRIEDEKMLFRHDRIREVLLVEGIGKLLKSNANDPLDIFWEPYYAEIIGQAIVRYPQSEAFLKELCNQLPLALLEAVRCFATPNNDYQEAIYKELQVWIDSVVSSNLVPRSILQEFCWKLIEIDSPLIIQITEQLPQYEPVLLSRIRNGCTNSGVEFCVGRNRFSLAPRSTDNIRDKVLEQAKSYHKQKIVSELRQLLTSPTLDDEQRAGALTFAGFLGFAEFENNILECWQLIEDKNQLLSHAIWASTQCCGDNPQILLDPLIKFWAELPDDQDSYGMSSRNFCLSDLRLSLPRYIRSHVLNYLIVLADKFESLRLSFVSICELIDTPSAVEFVVNSRAKVERSLVGTDLWLPPRTKPRELSQASLDRLFLIFNQPESDDFIKQNVSQLLPIDFEPLPFEELKDKYPNSFLLYNSLQKQVKLGDFRVLPDLINLLNTDYQWFYVAHGLWCDEIKEIAQNYLESFRNEISPQFFVDYLRCHIAVAHFLRKIPLKDADYLLNKYWDFLGFSALFIHTALYIGTPTSLALVDDSLSRFPKGTPVFEHLFNEMDDSSLKFLYKSQIRSMEDILYSLPSEKLQVLSKYIKYFDEDTIWLLGEVSQRVGKPNFGRQYLLERLSEKHRKMLYPTDEELVTALDKLEGKEYDEFDVSLWLDSFDKRHESKAKALRLIESWLSSNPKIERFKIAASCIANIGTRENNALQILDKYCITDSSDLVVKIKASTRFAMYRRTLD
jgi:hypothetical protein